MRFRTPASGARRSPRRGSILLVVLGVLTVLSLIGIAFVLFARTESRTARNYRRIAQAELIVKGELELIMIGRLDDMYSPSLVSGGSGVAWRLLNESHDFPNVDDGCLFGFRGDGQLAGVPPTPVLQVSLGGAAAPTVNNDDRDAWPDAVWRTWTLSDGMVAGVAVTVIDHGGLANLNIMGNIQDPATGAHNTDDGLGPYELNLMSVLALSAADSDQLDTYRALFLGRSTLRGRYGWYDGFANVGPGRYNWDDDRDSTPNIYWPDTDDYWRSNNLNEDVDDVTDEIDENLDEPSEYCYFNPGGSGDDADYPFDSVDLWQLLHNLKRPNGEEEVQSRLEVILGASTLDRPFDATTELGSYRQHLTTLSADPQWVGVGAADAVDRLQLRPPINQASLAELERAFQQAGFEPDEATQLAVNMVDYRDTNDNVTAVGDIHGHERQPYINEFFAGRYRQANSLNQFRAVAIELYNPYDTPINVYLWELEIIPAVGGLMGVTTVVLDNSLDDGVGQTWVPAKGYLRIVSVDSAPPPSTEAYQWDPALDSDSDTMNTYWLARPTPPDPVAGTQGLPWPEDNEIYQIKLKRARVIGQAPGGVTGLLYVDDTESRINFNLPEVVLPVLLPGPLPTESRASVNMKRPDAEVNLFQASVTPPAGPEHTLNGWNYPADTNPYYSVPIQNKGWASFGSVGDLGEVLTYTQNGNVPYTDDYAAIINPAEKEKDIKFGLSGDWYVGGDDTTADVAPRNVLDILCVNRPDVDGFDNDDDGDTDDAEEAGLPIYGRLNINTASQTMLARALTGGPFTSVEAAALAAAIVQRREDVNVGPFTHIGDLFRGPAVAAILGGLATDGADNDGDGTIDEKDERDIRFRYLANMITTRSNVFTVIITAEIRDPDRGELLASRKAIAIIDRSQAAMAVRYEGGTRVPYVTSPVIQRGFRWISD